MSNNKNKIYYFHQTNFRVPSNAHCMNWPAYGLVWFHYQVEDRPAKCMDNTSCYTGTECGMFNFRYKYCTFGYINAN